MQRHERADDVVRRGHCRVEAGLDERVEDALEPCRGDGGRAESVARMEHVPQIRRDHQEARKEELEEVERQRRLAATDRDHRRQEFPHRRVRVDGDMRSALFFPVSKDLMQSIFLFREPEPVFEVRWFVDVPR